MQANVPTLLDIEEFSLALRRRLEAQLTLSHPIFNELFTKGRNWPLLKILTLEGYQITKYFIQYIEHLFYRCPLTEHKRRLLINLYEEETGRISRTKNHIVLMEDFIRAQGITDEERDAYQPTPETLELINSRMDAVLGDATYHIGAAAVMIASEGQSLETRGGEPRHVMLAKAYGLTEQDTRFFAVHQQEDIGHVAEGVDLVAELCTTAEMQQEALSAVEYTCKLFWGMYDSAARRYYAIANGLEAQNAAE